MLASWNKSAISSGLLKIYIISTIGCFQSLDSSAFNLTKSKEVNDALHFQPCILPNYLKSSLNHKEHVSQKDYDTLLKIPPSTTQYWGAYTGFDNSPCRKNNARHMYPIVSPDNFKINICLSSESMDVKR